jgi:thiopeptide-type bacteriocin biosynthesis protein
MDQFIFLTELVVRAPFWSYADYNPQNLSRVLKNGYFQNAIKLANPGFYKIIKNKDFCISALVEKELTTLHKYYNRMCFRPTPFGGFATVGLARWGESQRVELVNAKDVELSLLPDQEVSMMLADYLLSKDHASQSFFVNPTLYKVGKEYRFVKTLLLDGKGTPFSLQSIAVDNFLKRLISFCYKCTRSGEEIINYIKHETACNTDEATGYLIFLADQQVLKSAATPNVLGDDYYSRATHHATFTDNEVSAAAKQYSILHITGKFTLETTLSINSCQKLVKLFNKPQPRAYFYANLSRDVSQGSLYAGNRQAIKDALTALSKLTDLYPQPCLEDFITKFRKRFDRAKVPLLLALDPDAGVGYGNISLHGAAKQLINTDDFYRPQNTADVKWSQVHSLILEKWVADAKEIKLNANDLDKLTPLQSQDCIPPTMSVAFREVDGMLIIESAGGASATGINGRFTLFNNAVYKLTTSIAKIEEDANPAILFAEISQLSEGHADNINRRKHIYTYEIPINTASTLPTERQIALKDVLVYIDGNEIILESITHQKRIMPRHTSAYNFTRNHLAVFRFLCDVQYQGLHTNLKFDLANLFPGLSNYPRVSFNKVILACAKWKFNATELTLLKTGMLEQRLGYLKQLIHDKRMPNVLSLNVHDHHLVFDVGDKKQASLLLTILEKQSSALLQEFLLPANDAGSTVFADGHPLNAQFVAFLYQTERTFKPLSEQRAKRTNGVKRELAPGSEWLYIKLYCTACTADQLLVKTILPFVSKSASNTIEQWFFIRYTDDGPHLRLRFKVKPGCIGIFFEALHNQLIKSPLYSSIHNYQVDTYKRELERYHPAMIEIVESHFCASSQLITRYLKHIKSGVVRYPEHSLSLVTTLSMIRGLYPGIQDQLLFLKGITDSMMAEFGESKSLKVSLDERYRKLKTSLTFLTAGNSYFKDCKIAKEEQIFNRSIKAIWQKACHLSQPEQNQLLADITHMHLNRAFCEQQREQELATYYVLYKHLLSIKARGH